MMVKTGKNRQEIAQENIKLGTVLKTETCQCVGKTMEKEGNLEEYIKVMARKCDTVSREVDAIGQKNRVGKEDIRVFLELFNTYPMTALIYGMEACGNIRSVEMREMENIQERHQKDPSFSNPYWYHNGNKNMASRTKDPTCYNDALS